MGSTDDDLDALLDDVLDDFNKPLEAPVSPPVAQPAAPSSASNLFATAPTSLQDLPELDDDLSLQLAKGMEALLAAAASGGEGEDEETARQVTEAFRKLVVGAEAQASASPDAKGKAVPAASSSSAPTVPPTTAGPTTPLSFQDAIAATMERMKEGKEEMNLAPPPDLAGLLSSFEQLLGADGADGLERMMEQMLSKEVMYEPMKEMGREYPPYLERHKVSPPDPAEYALAEQQYQIILEIVRIYEAQEGEPEAEGRKKVTELMQKMQELGNPPAEIVRALAPDAEIGPDGRPKLPGLPGGMGGLPPELDVPECRPQ
ncbi:Pex19 protein [Gonapodya prolifera JEL478]|uniref:Pex19 protein n=1 Tax=Gonapodya prolifera (strain JEL478) TaxID=1344416 RepID=A0A139AR19_GONPJ|nr:Pex19 protein [Gonapodya prolifera JEL478]|eukprot:KXS18963.1 Pex19 protein [Gonapodya prolifera JEL478]